MIYIFKGAFVMKRAKIIILHTERKKEIHLELINCILV